MRDGQSGVPLIPDTLYYEPDLVYYNSRYYDYEGPSYAYAYPVYTVPAPAAVAPSEYGFVYTPAYAPGPWEEYVHTYAPAHLPDPYAWGPYADAYAPAYVPGPWGATAHAHAPAHSPGTLEDKDSIGMHADEEYDYVYTARLYGDYPGGPNLPMSTRLDVLEKPDPWFLGMQQARPGHPVEMIQMHNVACGIYCSIIVAVCQVTECQNY